MSMLRSRTAGFVLTAAIVGLTLATANIHLGLGGLLFTLNGLGYTAMTIAGYLVMGPYFTLGFIAKGIEVALIAVLVVDVIRVYGSPMGLVRAALESVAPLLPERFRPTAA